MKRLLATTAVATMAFAGAASAQSVLERVLGQIDNSTNLASVNGTFANIAENIGGGTTNAYMDSSGNIISEAQYESGLSDVVNTANDRIKPTTGNIVDSTGDGVGDTTVAGTVGAYWYDANGDGLYTADEDIDAATIGDVANDVESLVVGVYENGFTAFQVSDGGIDGSITNLLDGIDQATQQAIASAGVSAIEWNMPTVDLGDMATTALGAVNTGDITLGVNSSVEEAKTSTTGAINAVVEQLGGSADTGAIILNVASNMTGVNGSINNVMNEVNGSIGNLSTTALGAVNTGTIVSGVDAAVAGIVGSTSGGAASN